MADELIRRSGRATKGHHSKAREEVEATPTSKGKKAKATKAKAVEEEEEEEDGDEIIRCVCGTYEEEEDVPRAMICCDNCSAWQHNGCMGLPEDYEPAKYFCEQCKPENHKELIAAMKRGEKPWEEATARHDAAKAKKKGKKGGRKSRTSEIASVASQDVEESPAPAPAPATAGQKRKLEDSPSVPDVKNKKARGTPAGDANGGKAIKTETSSRQASRSESVPILDLKDLKGTRKKNADTLIALVDQQITEAIKQQEYAVPSTTVAKDVATQLSLRIEQALYQVQSGGVGEPTDAYRNQLRAILTNVKKNRDLGVRLLNGALSPHGLASMPPAEMATEELKSKEKAMLKEVERQSTIVQEQGPRIRRTHKGEEYVDESRQVASESLTSNASVRKASAAEQDGDGQSPGIKSPSQAPALAGRGRSRPSVDTARRQSSANFDIDKVWSNVQGTPDGDGQRFGELPQATSPTAAVREPMAPGTKADADIDELLKDEDAESEPYSPKDTADVEGTVWRGVVDGHNLGRFHATARHAAGATPESDTLRMTYNDILPPVVDIQGRIQPVKADEYLCGLEYSNTSDLMIVCMPEPTNLVDQDGFDRLFRYFKNKDRFGVGVQHRNPAIKDIYLIPLDVGQELPTFVKKLETDFPDPVQEKMLLVPVVIKNSELAHNIAANAESGAVNTDSPSMRGGGYIPQTPITPFEGNFPHIQSPTVHQQNGAPQQGFPAPTPPASQQVQFPIQSSPPPNTSTVSAQKILGPELAACPSVVQLCASAPEAGENEFKIVKECLEQNPESRNDLGILTAMLQEVSAKSRSRA